jgi:3-hydroxyisobutyrate dehydrogenase-like beta-hydroxyacid dehydrogenase
MGSCEASYTAKLLGNMMGGVYITAISEAFAVAEKVGLDLSHFLKFAKESGGDSAQLNVRGPKIVDNDFSSLFGLDLLLKDMRLGCEMAEAVGVDVKTMKQAREAFLRASQQGFGREDAVAVFKTVDSAQ